jgi:hypothetical protein
MPSEMSWEMAPWLWISNNLLGLFEIIWDPYGSCSDHSLSSQDPFGLNYPNWQLWLNKGTANLSFPLPRCWGLAAHGARNQVQEEFHLPNWDEHLTRCPVTGAGATIWTWTNDHSERPPEIRQQGASASWPEQHYRVEIMPANR